MTTNTPTNYFTELASINVSEHLERKGQFNYLSWPYAVQQLRMFDETATWVVQRFAGLPYLTTDCGTFVEVAVTVKNITLSQIHPVLDSRNKTIPVPSAFDINTSIQRCLVKAIALHGLGLCVYAGEDLPNIDLQTDELSSMPNQKTLQSTFKPALIKSKIDKPELLTPNQLRYIKRLIMETGTDTDVLLAYINFDALDQIPKHEVNRVIQILESHRLEEAA